MRLACLGIGRLHQVMLGFAATLTLIIAPAAQAQTLSGAEDAAFQTALSAWLSSDEASALPDFATLATEGHTAAQLLLAVIDKTPSFQGPWLHHLDRAARIAILRQDGGLSGISWVHEAAATSEIAQVWRDLWHMQGGVELAQAFADRAEMRAARTALAVLASRTESPLDAELFQAGFARDQAYLGVFGADDASALDLGHPMRQLAGLPLAQADLRDWLTQSELAMPLRAVCANQCPATQENCTLALYQGLGSYEALLRLGPPVAALTSEEDWAHSPRGQSSLARRIMLRTPARMREITKRAVEDLDACAAMWLDAEYRQYQMPPRDASEHQN